MGGDGDPGKPLHPKMITVHTDPAKHYLVFQIYGGILTLQKLTDAEKELVKFKDSDVNSVDIFYVEKMYDTDPGDPGDGFGGISYRTGRNSTGNNAYQNFFIIAVSADNSAPPRIPTWPDSISFIHEMLHVLLDTSHRAADPDEAIIDADAMNTFAVDGPKRIGPFLKDTAKVGDGDTTKLRDSAKQLPP